MGVPNGDRTDGHYDVVVVGGRVAGASTALLLARAGHRVAVLDRARFPSDTLSTHLLWPTGVVHLRRWGMLDALVAAGTPPLHEIRNDIDGVATTTPVWAESGEHAVYAPRRTVLDPMLLDAAEAAGAVVHEGVVVDGLTRAADGRIDGVVAHTGDGAPLHLSAHFVVGADGARSRVAREVEAEVHDTHAVTNAVHYAYWSGLDDRGVELWYRTSGVMAGVFPTNEGAVVYVNCRTERFGEHRGDLDGAFPRLAEEAAPDLAERLRGATQTSRVRATPGLPGIVRQPYGPGWLLVGDAGCTKDPASAHGMSAALRDAELAAIAIDTALREPPRLDVAMHEFHTHRDASRALYDVSWAMASYDWDAPGLLGLEMRFVAELVGEARDSAALPTWAGTGVPTTEPRQASAR